MDGRTPRTLENVEREALAFCALELVEKYSCKARTAFVVYHPFTGHTGLPDCLVPLAELDLRKKSVRL